jgi:hypothetical protein
MCQYWGAEIIHIPDHGSPYHGSSTFNPLVKPYLAFTNSARGAYMYGHTGDRLTANLGLRESYPPDLHDEAPRPQKPGR